MSARPRTRRRFLEMVAQGGALASAASLGVGCGAGGLGGTYAAGNVSAFPAGTLRAFSSDPVAVGHDAGGIYAMSLICTHAGCNIAMQGAVSASGVVCNCHGSRFDAQGNRLAGPARTPLDHLAVTIDASGAVTVNGDLVVAASVRAAP
jgi:nitrite reductase/ring-hydroxylating ferredoxin subunit